MKPSSAAASLDRTLVEIDRMLKNSQTKVIMPVVTLFNPTNLQLSELRREVRSDVEEGLVDCRPRE